METEQNRNEAGTEQTGDESVEEFVEQVENDPATATSGDDALEEVRGG